MKSDIVLQELDLGGGQNGATEPQTVPEPGGGVLVEEADSLIESSTCYLMSRPGELRDRSPSLFVGCSSINSQVSNPPPLVTRTARVRFKNCYFQFFRRCAAKPASAAVLSTVEVGSGPHSARDALDRTCICARILLCHSSVGIGLV